MLCDLWRERDGHPSPRQLIGHGTGDLNSTARMLIRR